MPHQITLHHLNASRSVRIWWLLEELEIPYDYKVYFRTASFTAPPELKQVSPFGKSPVVTIDGENVWESGYIVYRLMGLVPDCPNVETIPSNDSVYWSHFAEGTLMSYLQNRTVVDITSEAWTGGAMGNLGEEGKDGVKQYAEWLKLSYFSPADQTNLEVMNQFLSVHSGKFFSGTDKPGQGDFMLSFAVQKLAKGGKLGSGLTAYWDMVSKRPAFARALEKMKKAEAAGQSKSSL